MCNSISNDQGEQRIYTLGVMCVVCVRVRDENFTVVAGRGQTPKLHYTRSIQGKRAAYA